MKNISMELIREIATWRIEFIICIALILGFTSVMAFKLEKESINKSKIKKVSKKKSKQVGKMYNFIVKDKVA